MDSYRAEGFAETLAGNSSAGGSSAAGFTTRRSAIEFERLQAIIALGSSTI